MDYIFYICEIVYILFCLPSHQCQAFPECGTLRGLNTDHINPGDVRLELSNIRNGDTSLVQWWINRTIRIDTNLQRFSIVAQQAHVTLTIRNVTAEDNGRYTVDLGRTPCYPPKDVLVTVKEPKALSIIPQFPDSVNIPELDCANCLVGTVGVYNNVECIVSGSSEKNMNIELKLKKNGQEVPNVIVEAFPFYRAFYGYMSSEEDTDHSITCEATRDGQQPLTVSITLVVLRRPSIPTIALPDSIKEGKHAHISCKTFNARPKPRLYFMYNSTTYNTSNSFSKAKGDITVDAETIIRIPFSRYDNNRSIHCCVEFKEYHRNTQKINMKCSTSAINVLFPPTFLQLQELNRTNDAEGHTSILLQCTSDASNPVSKIRWNIPSDFQYESSHEKDKILSANLTRHNNGESLSCYIENPAFPDIKVFKTYELNITYKPLISFSPISPVTTYVDDSITVLCQCDANPPAKIEWSNTSSNEIGKRTEYSLELNMQFHSTGRLNFSCNAKNTIGSAENVVLIVVKDQLLSTSCAPTCTCNDLSSSILIGIICGSLAVLIVVVVVVGFVVVSKIRQNTQRSEEYTDLHFQEHNLYMQPLGPVHDTSDGSQSPDRQQTQTYESLE